MNETDKRREARRRRILENSESRFKKITILNTTNDVVLNESLVNENDINVSKIELPELSVQKCHVENVTPATCTNQNVFNYEPYEPDEVKKIHNKHIKYFKVNLSYTTTLHIILSQVVLVLIYNDLGFLFGNSILVPFFLSAIPELYMSKEQHNSLHTIVLLMIGFSQDKAKHISRCIMLASITGKQFCIYIFFFTCSYAALTNIYLDVKHNTF